VNLISLNSFSAHFGSNNKDLGLTEEIYTFLEAFGTEPVNGCKKQT
jgi:hypothetical protein